MTDRLTDALEILRAAIAALSEEAMLQARSGQTPLPAREDLIDARLAAVGRDMITLAEAARVLRRLDRLGRP
jgi:hypothetical protein